MADELHAPTDEAAPESAVPETLIGWPPPGLERIQGDTGRIAGGLMVGGLVFTLPLLASLTITQDLWSLGIFGEAWWILAITSVTGGAVLLWGYVALFRLFRRVEKATERGYATRMVALVAADRSRDSGFLMQGRGPYSLLAPQRRGTLLTGRLWIVRLQLAAAFWLSAGFIVGVLFAAQGVLGETGLAMWTLLPSGAGVILAAALSAREIMTVRRARREWYRRPWAEDLARDEIRLWHEALEAREGAVVVGTADLSGRGTYRAGAATALLAAAAVIIVGVPLVIGSSLGPVIALIAAPSFSSTIRKAARSEALAPWRLPSRPDVTPRIAGEALASLSFTGREPDPSESLVQPPARAYEQPFFENDEFENNPTGMEPRLWARDLVPRLSTGLDDATLAYLEEKGRHPALGELRILAGAELIEYAGTVWVSPLPSDLPFWQLPFPRYGGVRDAAYVTVGAAVAAAANGRVDEAEARLLEVVTAGLLMAEEGSMLITNLIGYVLVGTGGGALANIYDVFERPADAAALRTAIDAAERGAEVALSVGGSSSWQAYVDISEAAGDSGMIRGFFWERYVFLNTIGPCFNLNRAVFGPPPAYEQWMADARSALVRTEAEAQLFDLGARGLLVSEDESSGWLNGLMRLVLGREQGPGGCAAAF